MEDDPSFHWRPLFPAPLVRPRPDRDGDEDQDGDERDNFHGLALLAYHRHETATWRIDGRQIYATAPRL
jgi:hypothetical protein